MRELRELRVQRHGEFVLLEVTANAFLHHMVRNIAGLLIHIGTGRGVARSRDRSCWLPANRRLAPATAPAAGLYLWRVHYPPVFGLPDDSDIMVPAAGCPADLMV